MEPSPSFISEHGPVILGIVAAMWLLREFVTIVRKLQQRSPEERPPQPSQPDMRASSPSLPVVQPGSPVVTGSGVRSLLETLKAESGKEPSLGEIDRHVQGLMKRTEKIEREIVNLKIEVALLSGSTKPRPGRR